MLQTRFSERSREDVPNRILSCTRNPPRMYWEYRPRKASSHPYAITRTFTVCRAKRTRQPENQPREACVRGNTPAASLDFRHLSGDEVLIPSKMDGRIAIVCAVRQCCCAWSLRRFPPADGKGRYMRGDNSDGQLRTVLTSLFESAVCRACGALSRSCPKPAAFCPHLYRSSSKTKHSEKPDARTG